MARHYLDHASTSPLRPEARDAMVAWLEASTRSEVADPSRIHVEGMTSRGDARARPRTGRGPSRGAESGGRVHQWRDRVDRGSHVGSGRAGIARRAGRRRTLRRAGVERGLRRHGRRIGDHRRGRRSRAHRRGGARGSHPTRDPSRARPVGQPRGRHPAARGRRRRADSTGRSDRAHRRGGRRRARADRRSTSSGPTCCRSAATSSAAPRAPVRCSCGVGCGCVPSCVAAIRSGPAEPASRTSRA